MRRKQHIFSILVVLAFLLAQTAVAFDGDRTGILAVTNISGARQGDLEKRVSTAVEDFLSKTAGFKVVSNKEIRKRLDRLQLSEVEKYLPLLSAKEISALCRRLEVDRILTVTIDGYNEFVRKKQKTCQIKLNIEEFLPGSETAKGCPGEAITESGIDDAVKTAVKDAGGKLLGTAVEDPAISSARSFNAPVVVNKKSKRYHLPDARHLPGLEDQIPYGTRRQAEADGYLPCPVCFPSNYSYYDPDRRLEDELGAQAAGTVEYYYRVAYDPEKMAWVKRVADTIVPVTGRKNVEYKLYLLDTDSINAFSLPGGYVYVTTGLLKIVENDDELAFVLAHEMAHNVRKHALAQYRLAMGMQFFTLLLILGGDKDDREKNYLLSSFLNGLIQTGYSRDQEREADELGLVYLIKSGRDPGAYRSVFGKFIDLETGNPYLLERIFATHPRPEERIKLLDGYLDGLRRLKAELAW